MSGFPLVTFLAEFKEGFSKKEFFLGWVDVSGVFGPEFEVCNIFIKEALEDVGHLCLTSFWFMIRIVTLVNEPYLQI